MSFTWIVIKQEALKLCPRLQLIRKIQLFIHVTFFERECTRDRNIISLCQEIFLKYGINLITANTCSVNFVNFGFYMKARNHDWQYKRRPRKLCHTLSLLNFVHNYFKKQRRPINLLLKLNKECLLINLINTQHKEKLNTNL